MKKKQSNIMERKYMVPQIELLNIQVEAGFSSSEEGEFSTGGDGGDAGSLDNKSL